MVIIILLIYLAAMFIIGFYFSRKVNNMEDFFLGGRNLPWPVVMLTFASSWIGASSTLAKSGLAYEVGFAALTPTFATIFSFLIFSFISPKIRRIGVKYNISSIPDLMNRRFGKKTAFTSAIIIAWTLVGTVGTQMVATSKVLKIICKPWDVSYEGALVISLIIIVFYTVLSGMYGIAYTDVIQGIILFVTIGIILPITAYNMAGGFEGLTAKLDPSFFSLKIDSKLLGYSWVYLLYFLAGPIYWQRAFSSDSEVGAQKGVFRANVLILFYSFAVTVIGVCAVIIYPVFPYNMAHEALIPLMLKDMFPEFLYALVIAALMAVLMSTIDSYLLTASQTIVSDLCKIFNSKLNEEKQLVMSKYSILVLGICALVFALNIRVILDAFVIATTFFSSAMAIPSLAALYWKKATKEGIFGGMITGVVVSLTWSVFLKNPFDIHEAFPGGILCLAVIVFVSILTYNKENEVPFFN